LWSRWGLNPVLAAYSTVHHSTKPAIRHSQDCQTDWCSKHEYNYAFSSSWCSQTHSCLCVALNSQAMMEILVAIFWHTAPHPLM
jgi:hypothetical protein